MVVPPGPVNPRGSAVVGVQGVERVTLVLTDRGVDLLSVDHAVSRRSSRSCADSRYDDQENGYDCEEKNGAELPETL